MKEHTKEKLLVYKEYLKNYLSVMCRSKWPEKIFIWEPFAGKGIDENNEKGSAVIAAEMVSDFRAQYPEKNIRLTLNELDKGKYEQLKQSVNEYGSFVDAFNKKAEDFLSRISSSKTLMGVSRESHNLFFIDPYGYTQYSKENLYDLLGQRNSEYLIFMPTSYLYRFKKAKNNRARRFTLDLGVKASTLDHDTGIASFAEELVKRLKERAETDFGYSYSLENREAPNSIFHLFFITKHIRGAEKFLEAKNTVKEKLKNQLTLIDTDELDRKQDLIKILAQQVTNKVLFREIIKRGSLAKEIKPILKKLENEEHLEVGSDSGRNRKGFYLKENPDKIITIRYKA